MLCTNVKSSRPKLCDISRAEHVNESVCAHVCVQEEEEEKKKEAHDCSVRPLVHYYRDVGPRPTSTFSFPTGITEVLTSAGM